MYVKLDGSYFVHNKVILPNNNNVINIYIVYELYPISNFRSTDYTIQNALFADVKITKNTDTSKNKYEGHSICFDEHSNFSFGDRIDAKSALIFGVDMSFRTYANNKANNNYVLGKGLVQGINGTTLYDVKV